MAASLGLVLMHRGIARLGFRFDAFGKLVKGQTRVLIRNGDVQWDAMRKSAIGEEDLKSALRRKGQKDIEDIALACLERNGEITIVPQGG